MVHTAQQDEPQNQNLKIIKTNNKFDRQVFF